jgi:hypothetical protein
MIGTCLGLEGEEGRLLWTQGSCGWAGSGGAYLLACGGLRVLAESWKRLLRFDQTRFSADALDFLHRVQDSSLKGVVDPTTEG